MRTLNTLRNLIILFFLCAAAASASATDRASKPQNKAHRGVHHQAVAHQRKEAAAFVDPTLPLAEFVERLRDQQAR